MIKNKKLKLSLKNQQIKALFIVTYHQYLWKISPLKQKVNYEKNTPHIWVSISKRSGKEQGRRSGVAGPFMNNGLSGTTWQKCSYGKRSR